MMMRFIAIVAATLMLAGCFGRGPKVTPMAAAVVPARIIGIGNASFAFSPLSGVPEKTQKAILDAVVADTGQPARDAVAFRVDGYVTAVGERTATLVIYVWDVFDPAGRRIHRVSGQVNSLTGSERDAWEGVTDETIRELADRTVADLKDWSSRG